MGSGGIGTTPHVTGELFQIMTGVELVHVPYRTNFMPDVFSGQIQVMFVPIPTVIGYIRAGKLRALAVTTAAPSAALPGVPTAAEFVSGYEASTWVGIVAPKATPVEIVQKLNTEVNAGFFRYGDGEATYRRWRGTDANVTGGIRQIHRR